MAANSHRTQAGPLHPIHAVLLAGALPLFLGAFVSDLAYASTYQLQWKNFASWLIAGGLGFAGLALAWALAGLALGGWRAGLGVLYVLLLAAAWGLGLVNALVHAMDAWAGMPMGAVLSAIVAALTLLAVGIGFSTLGARRPQ